MGFNSAFKGLKRPVFYAIKKVKKQLLGKVQCQHSVRAVSGGLDHNRTYKASHIFYGVYKHCPY
jgi:hypothetical protein